MNDNNQNEIADILDMDSMSFLGPIKARVILALDYIVQYGGTDGAHHKQWVLDQVTRALTGCPMVTVSATDVNGIPYTYEKQGDGEDYIKLVAWACDGEDGPDTYAWDEGCPP